MATEWQRFCKFRRHESSTAQLTNGERASLLRQILAAVGGVRVSRCPSMFFVSATNLTMRRLVNAACEKRDPGKKRQREHNHYTPFPGCRLIKDGESDERNGTMTGRGSVAALICRQRRCRCPSVQVSEMMRNPRLPGRGSCQARSATNGSRAAGGCDSPPAPPPVSECPGVRVRSLSVIT
jgi:hypothetical protein